MSGVNHDLKFDGTKVFSDTHPEIERRMIEGMLRMSPAKKLQKISNIGQFMKQAAYASIKRQHLEASDWECLMRVMSRSLPEEMMRKAYGWNVREQGNRC